MRNLHDLFDPIRRHDDDNFPTDMSERLTQLLVSDVLDCREIEAARIPIDYAVYLTVGGGVGSFIWADNLLVCGAKQNHIMSLGMEKEPYGRYRRLCRQSQIPDHERLRSDSGSTPDNIWGWPGYAVREAVSDTTKFHLNDAGQHIRKIFGEPILSEVYTPRAKNVYDSMDREAKRIGWDQMHRLGRVSAIRKLNNGYYAIFYLTKTIIGFAERCVIASYVHLAVGYPGARMLPELAQYRYKTGDHKCAVNAYEDHDHVYDILAKHGGLVAVRGRGIVASRILQRLCEVREQQPNLKIIHILRRPVHEPSEFRGVSRTVDHHWELQPYNFPKSAWGGPYRELFENADETTRADLLKRWGGTTTADRQDWRDIVDQGKREGWYTVFFGDIVDLMAVGSGKIGMKVKLHSQNRANMSADFLIDATGLDTDWRRSDLLRDLIETYKLPLNMQNRIQVSDTFEIEAMRTANGRMFAVGAMTLGAGFAPVDSFLGLQYAAQMTLENLVSVKAPCLDSLSPTRSLGQWSRWMIGAKP